MSAAPTILPRSRVGTFADRLRAGDQFAYTLTLVCAASIFLVTCLLVYELWIGSALSREKFGWNFIFTSTWDPVREDFGAVPFMFGTVVTSLVSLLISVPIGLGAAIFLSEMALPSISDTLTFLIELLAAVPSVIYGLLGIFLLVPVLESVVVPVLKGTLGFLPIFSGPFYGVSLFSASVVLSVMIVPFIISVSREVLLAVPVDQREAALSVGATKWETTWQVVVPYAKRGIYGSIFLALARALGETMAVTMVIGNTPKVQTSLLGPGDSIASVIANQFTEATSDMYISALIELGLVLFAITIIINGLARLLILTTGGRVAK
ncbi:MAG TPA: phosphate ABC transporter permease subunit PstC [Bryobacteraceae bacterium]|nr:phosphate ABC transporter permease subunit PstC [Bryobacteraceae bacterium]